MRTMEGYNEQVASVLEDYSSSSVYGIKSDSCLNQLSFYHVIGGLPSDLAHDFFEGVLVDMLSYITVALINEGHFSLDEFNDKVTSFKYSKVDLTNKPQEFTKTSLTTFKIKLTAAEMWNFVRLYPLMYGELVPVGNLVWSLLAKILDVVELLTVTRYLLGNHTT